MALQGSAKLAQSGGRSVEGKTDHRQRQERMEFNLCCSQAKMGSSFVRQDFGFSIREFPDQLQQSSAILLGIQPLPSRE